MLAVIDVNIVFSALVTKGNSLKVFKSNKEFPTFEFMAPDFLFFELGKRIDKLLVQSKLAKEEISNSFSLIKSAMTLVPAAEFLDRLPEALALNEKDAQYLALALKLGCPIISGDKGLKEQARVKVLSPAEALEMVCGSGLLGLEP